MEKQISPDNAPESTVAPAEKTMQQLLQEAEEAGYRRGRAEAVELALEKWERSADLAPDLLVQPRKSFWD